MRDFNNFLKDLKLIMFDNNSLTDMFFNQIEMGFERIALVQELKSTPQDLTLGIYQLIMNQFLDIFILMDSMEQTPDEEPEEEDDNSGCWQRG